MVPRWKQKLNETTAAAEKVADAERCAKTKLVRVYLGSFVERDERARCLLDIDHFGECCANPHEVEKMKDEPHPDTPMDVIQAGRRPHQW